MGLFDLFRKKTAPVKTPEDPEPTAAREMSTDPEPAAPQVQIVDTPETYRHMADQIVPPVLELLRTLSQLEEEIFRRSQELEAQKLAKGISAHQVAPGWEALIKEYRARIYDLASPWCTEKLLSRGYGTSYGSPTHYDYLSGTCQILFTMKSAKRAVIETRFHESIDKAEQFILRPAEGVWKIDEINYRFSDESTWHTHHIC